ncbi:MAG: choice-of-anchor tandem repeat GloVer-containing protein [Candidatus Korobacteraceae bacterium]
MSGKQQSRNLIFAATLNLTFIALAIASVWGQSAVPPTARQAATMPQFASRLAPPSVRPAAGKSPLPVLSRAGAFLPQDQVVYENGPVNGQVDAWTLNSGFAATDSIQVNSSIGSLNFWAWLIPGDTITNIQVSVGSTPFGSDLFNGVVSLSQANCFTNSYGYNVCLESGNITSGPTLSGNAWVTLQNASVPSGDPVYWDENSGVGCYSPGCPSQAQENTVGTIPSEAFTVLGSSVNCGPSNDTLTQATHSLAQILSQTFSVIYNFTGGGDGATPQGLTLDKGGNFYGTAGGGGLGAGTVYKLSHSGSGWVLNTLYRFTGANDGYGPSSRVTIGPDGSLYGVTWLGGSDDAGVVFNLKPGPAACPNAMCTWKETVLHAFSGFDLDSRGGGSCSLQQPLKVSAQRSLNSPADGTEPSGDLVFDSAGNLYGTAPWGGSGPGNCGCGFPCGILYQLTPSGSGWQENILYNFQGSADGGNPNSGVILDSDGNLVGTTSATGGGGGSVFRWTQQGFNVLHDFGYRDGNGSRAVGGLTYDQAGNLYGTTAAGGIGCGGCGCGTAFAMPNSGGFQVLNRFTGSGYWPTLPGPQSSLVMDRAGNLYGTTLGDGAYGLGSVFELVGGWNYIDLHDFTGGNDGYRPSVLTVDASGNIWGTAQYGGAYGAGVIFEITP